MAERDRDLDLDLDVDLDPALRAALREGGGGAGTGATPEPTPEPTPEELLAYHRGELSEEEAERFEERLAAHPDAVLLLAAFTEREEPRPGNPDYLSETDRSAAREELRRRMDERERRPGAAVLPLRPPAPRPAIPRWAERIAAVLLIGLLGGLWAARGQRIERLDREVAELRGPRVGVEQRTVLPDSERRGTAEDGVRRFSRDRSHLLTLAMREQPKFSDYRLEIVPAGAPEAGPLWSRAGLVREADDTFDLFLPAGWLPAGEHRIHLLGIDGEEETPLATYSIEMF